MTHPSADDLSAYCDGELSAPLCASLAEHLSGCSTCKDTLRRWQEQGAMFARLGPPVPSPAFAVRVWEHIEAQEQRRLSFWRWRDVLIPALGTACTAAMLIAASHVASVSAPPPTVYGLLAAASPDQTMMVLFDPVLARNIPPAKMP